MRPTPRTSLAAILALALTATLAACGGGASGSSGTNGTTTTTPNSVTGLVTDVGTGGRLGGATVTGGGLTTTSGADGSFHLANLAAGPIRLTFSKAGYAPGYANALSSASGGDALIVKLKKTGGGTSYDPATAKVFTTTTEAGPYRLALDANSLDTTGTTGPYTVTVTPLDPTKEADALPGNLDASGAGTAVLLPVTFAEFSILDASGVRLNLKSSASATVELPIPAALRSTYPLGTTIHCYAYSPTAGAWNDFVDGTVVTSSEDGVTPVLRAALRHFSWYGGAPQGNDCIDQWVKVTSAVDGKPLPNARVEATPGTTAYTDADGFAYLRTARGGRTSTYTAYRTYTDTDGSVSGMPGAKVIEFGRVEEDLTGLTPGPCSAAPTGAAPRGGAHVAAAHPASADVSIAIGVVKNAVYEATAQLYAGTIMVLLEQGLPAPDGTIESGTRIDTAGARITLTPAGGSALQVPQLAAGAYMLTSAAITPGRAYTLAIDADGNGSVEAYSTVVAVGELSWSRPTDGGTVSAADLAGTASSGWARLADTAGASGAAYAPFYWVSVSPTTSLQSLAFYTGTSTSFPLTNAYDFQSQGTAPLLPGTYQATAMAFSGFNTTASGISQSNNIVGANVTGQFYSLSATAAITFTVQ